MAAIRKVTLADGKTRWRLRLYTGTDDTGKQEVITRTFDLKRDADAELTRLKGLKDAGGLVAPSKETLGRFLRRFVDGPLKGSIRARTYDDYDGVLRRYFEHPPENFPLVGGVRLDRLQYTHIQGLYDAMGKHGLSPRTIRSLHAVVRQGLAYATRTGAVARNVADLVVLPKQDKREVKAMTSEEATRFLEAARGDRYYALWAVLLTGGLRPSEACGLQWGDFDPDGGKLRVERALTRRGSDGWALVPPKTQRGRRAVVLPAFAVQALREWRAKQAAEKLQLGSEYGDNGFIFATEFGTPLSLTNLYARNFRRVMAAAGLGEWQETRPRDGTAAKPLFRPAFRLYDLRHTAATLLLRDGENPKVTSERLGHSSVAFTMDVYSASLPDMQEAAAEKMEARFGGL